MDFRLEVQRGPAGIVQRRAAPWSVRLWRMGGRGNPRLKEWLRPKGSAEMPPGLLANGLEWLMLPRLVPEPDLSRTVPERNLKDADSLTLVQQISNRYRRTARRIT